MPDYLKRIEIELKLGGYNKKTVTTYQKFIKEYLEFKGNDVGELDVFSIKEFIVGKYEKGNSRQTIDLYVNAIKFFYKEIIGVDKEVKIKLPKATKKEAVFLQFSELKRLFESLKNVKHRLICQLSFGCGLRISEVLNLKIADVDLENRVVKVMEGRTVVRESMLPLVLIDELQQFIGGRQSGEFLFLSQMGGRLSERGIQKVFADLLKSAGIKKPATFHSLRHSFAVELLNKGVAVRHVQKLLGLKNPRAVHEYQKLIEFKLTNIQSPLDRVGQV